MAAASNAYDANVMTEAAAGGDTLLGIRSQRMGKSFAAQVNNVADVNGILKIGVV